MLPPHLPPNRRITNGTSGVRARRPVARTAAAKADARRIELKAPLRIGGEKPQSMIARMRKEKARLC
jgi:hypothetical protein